MLQLETCPASRGAATPAIRQAENNKRRACGCGPIVEGVRPLVVEQHGRLGDAAYALILNLAGNRACSAALTEQLR